MGYSFTTVRYLEDDKNIIRDLNHPIAQQIRELHTRGGRDRAGLFFAQGSSLFIKAVQRQAEFEYLVFAPEISGRNSYANEMFIEQKKKGISCYALAPDVFESICYDRLDWSYIGMVVRPKHYKVEEILTSVGLCWVALDRVSNLQSLGTILRTSHAIQGEGIIVLHPDNDVYNPSCIKASEGAIFSQKVIQIDYQEFVKWKREVGDKVFLVGHDLPGVASRDYKTVKYRKPLIFIMSHTDLNLPPLYRDICDCIVHVPTIPNVEGRDDHLDSATTAGLLMYEVFNQQRGVV